MTTFIIIILGYIAILLAAFGLATAAMATYGYMIRKLFTRKDDMR